METSDVIVVGAGPAGLTAAGDLARLGRRVTVLERRPSRNPASRAFAVMPRTLELLESRGVTQALLPLGDPVDHVALFGEARLDLAAVPSPFPYGLITPQTNVDAALETYAERHGAHVVRGTEVVGLEQDRDGVVVTTRPREGGGTTTWCAPWVVAADGAHSTVRDLLHVDFPGRTVLRSVVLADVRPVHPPEGTGLTVGSTRDEFGFLAPYGNGWFRSMTWDRHDQQPDSAPVDDRRIAPVLEAAMGRDIGVAEVSWRSRFHCDERQVAAYRHGRVLLVGDAAHVHSPVGGQGMNTGIQDAVNLAWKLDAALGGAPDAVVDSYQTERHPVGRRVLLQSGTMLRAIILRPRPARALRNLIAPILLRRRRFAAFVSGSFTGTSLRYAAGPGDHALVGTRAVQVPLTRGTLLGLQQTPGWVLVRESGSAPTDSLPPAVHDAERADAGPALLVRPDGYLAWAGSTAGGGWRAALARWTGTSGG